MFKLRSPYFYSLVDLSQAEFLLSGLKQLFEKQNDEHSKLQNKLGIKPVENYGILFNHSAKFFFSYLINCL